VRPSLPALRELWRLGLPIGGTYMVEVGLFAFAALCMGVLGSTELAAHQIALQIVSTAFMVPAGLSYAVTMRVGQHYGAGNLLAARSAGRVGIGFGAMVMLCFAALFLLLPEALVGLFIDHNDPAFAAIFQLAVQPADGGGVVRAVRRHADHRHGLDPWAQGCQDHLPDRRWCATGWWGRRAPGCSPSPWAVGRGIWWGLALGLACAAVALTFGFEWRMKRMLARRGRELPCRPIAGLRRQARSHKRACGSGLPAKGPRGPPPTSACACSKYSINSPPAAAG
jgi:MATE family multidrug resistance protein